MLQRFFFLFIVALILPDIYIYRTIIPYTELNLLVKLLYWLPTILLFMGLIHFLYLPNKKAQNININHWFIGALLFFAIPKVVFTICSLAGHTCNFFFSWDKIVFESAGVGLALITAGYILVKSIFAYRNKPVENNEEISPLEQEQDLDIE
ncbi:MAG: hypothetical protein LUH22_15745 [Bacteroides sp.]|nr:hypothetical protein [Bacteroides sp.]